MKKSELKLILLVIVVIIFSLFNVFARNIVNEYLIAFVLGIMFIISYVLVGFERERMRNKKKRVRILLFLAVGFLIIEFGLGLIVGFQKSSYSFKFISLIRNVLPVILISFTGEMFRYQLCTKGDRSIIVLSLTIIMFTSIDILMQAYLYDLSKLDEIILMLVTVGMASVCKNIMLCDFSLKYGYSLTLIYSIVYSTYIYFVPVFPNDNGFIKTIFRIVTPIITMFMIDNLFMEKYKKCDYDKRVHIFKVIVSFVSIGFLFVIVVLVSNIFRYWAVTIASGSMTPTLMVGDIAIVDKIYQKKPEKLKNNDILVFRMDDKIYTHRIINILYLGDECYINTKGDREGQKEDTWTVMEDNIIGVVKLKVRYIGYPTVWLSELKKVS